MLEIKNANDGAIGSKRSFTRTSTYVTDEWTDGQMDTGRQQRRAYAQCFAVKTASNSVNVLLHRLNNTHLLTAVPG